MFVRWHVDQLEGRVHIRHPVLRRLPETNAVVLDLAKELGLCLTGSASLESFSVLVMKGTVLVEVKRQE